MPIALPSFASVRGTVQTPRWPGHGTVQKRVMAAGRVDTGGGADERKENRLSLTTHSAFTKHAVTRSWEDRLGLGDP